MYTTLFAGIEHPDKPAKADVRYSASKLYANRIYLKIRVGPEEFCVIGLSPLQFQAIKAGINAFDFEQEEQD